jgi:hypothetical protein
MKPRKVQVYRNNLESERVHREKVIKKLEKIQGLTALLQMWEERENINAENHLYVAQLRRKLRQIETQYKAMRI